MAVAGVLATTAIVLTGCGIPNLPGPTPTVPDRSEQDAVNAINEVPGVAGSNLNGGSTGLPWLNDIGIDMALEKDYPGDKAKLLNYVLAQLWSQNEVEPTTGVRVHMSVLNGTTVNTPVFLYPIGKSIGFTHTDAPFTVGEAEMIEHFGKWPGKVPTLPVELAKLPTSPPLVQP